MKVAIIDDECTERERLTTYLQQYGRENGCAFETKAYESGIALLDGYQPVYDLLIFDIDMPGMSGLDTARKVRELDPEVVILFVTNMAQYAIHGYEVEAVDYILKPVGYYDFVLKLQKALRRMNRRQQEYVVIDTTEGLVRLAVSDLLYVEVIGHYLLYHKALHVYKVRGSMKEKESELLRFHFCRCHKSYLVNLAHVVNIRTTELIVDREIVPMGRAYKDDLMMDYMRYLRGNV